MISLTDVLSAKGRKIAKEIALINEVKEQPCIYNRELSKKTSTMQKDTLWIEIANSIIPSKFLTTKVYI